MVAQHCIIRTGRIPPLILKWIDHLTFPTVGTVLVMVSTGRIWWTWWTWTYWYKTITVIYIDQPIGVGFSYGIDTVNSTYTAAPPVWSTFQILFESQAFSKYKSRELVPIYMRRDQSCWLFIPHLQVYFRHGELWRSLWTRVRYVLWSTECPHSKPKNTRCRDCRWRADNQQVSTTCYDC